MIKLILGNVGSGKTASIVRYMKMNPHKKFITNIGVKGKGISHIQRLKPEMLIKKRLVRTMRDGTPVYEKTFNQDFWRKLVEKEQRVNIVIDEAHQFFNPRRSMSKINIIMTDFLSMLRRVLGTSDIGGELILITQLSRRLDIIAKEMANDVQYCVHHYITECQKCGFMWQENNESSIRMNECPACDNWNIKKIKSEIEVFHFRSIDKFALFINVAKKTYYRHYFIKDIEKVFNNYDTLQFDDMLSNY